MRTCKKRLVVTNGCFDLLHLGHVTYLETARNLGDALLVGLNSDSSVQGLKGPGRPVNNENDRAAVLAALESLDGVCIFSEVSALRFLTVAQPDVYVKGGDYTWKPSFKTNARRWRTRGVRLSSFRSSRANPRPGCSKNCRDSRTKAKRVPLRSFR